MTELSLASLSLQPPSIPRCEVCHDLDIFHLKVAASSLLEGAEKGCKSCILLKEGVSRFCTTYTSIRLLVDGTLFATLEEQDKKDIGIMEFYTRKGHPSIWEKVGVGRDVSEDSSSDECILLARRWLQGCLDKHTACSRSSVPLVPTRVIDVGMTDNDTRLCELGTHRAEYVALSHCWGGGTPLVTRSDTLEERKAGIRFDHNSQTFKDAVSVTRRLGIPYLWIDSLCIVQDSKEDWEREAGRMSKVYNNATLTISADAATTPEDGLFPKDRKLLNRTEMISCTGSGTDANSDRNSSVYVRSRNDDPFYLKNTTHSSQSRENTKLSTRGWVLQEELLSPRILHFEKAEMSWICATYSRCECRIRPGIPIPALFRRNPTTFAPSAEFTYRVHLEWPFVVADFTRRNLTFPSDRLAAMSGLAAWIEERTTDSYFAGVWYEDMAFHLLWYSAADEETDKDKQMTRYPTPYAPSWTWTSISGPISYPGRGTSMITSSQPEQPKQSVAPLLTVVGVWRLPVNPELNQYGPVRSAVLQLFARIIPVTYDTSSKTWHPNAPISHFDPSTVRTNIDVPSEFDPESWPLSSADPARPQYLFVLAGQWSGREMTAIRKQAVCLLVRRMTTQADHDRLFWSMLHFRTLLCQGDSYVRVGYVTGAGSISGWERAVSSEIVHLL